MTDKKKLNNNPFERSQPVTSDFFDIPLIGMVSNSTSGDYHLSDLVSNFRHANQEFITLEVLDNAMRKAGILKGDFLTVDLNSRPCNGDITVVKLGERFYIRKFYQQNNLIRLETADDYPNSLVIESKTPGFAILGKVQSVFRQF
jgi:SOS-response transcriptional repressor LexA